MDVRHKVAFGSAMIASVMGGGLVGLSLFGSSASAQTPAPTPSTPATASPAPATTPGTGGTAQPHDGRNCPNKGTQPGATPAAPAS